MIKIIKNIVFLCLFIFLNMVVFADDQIVIESKLFRGVSQATGDYPHEVIITAFSTPFFIPETSRDVELKKGTITSLKNELNKVFQVKRIEHLVSGNMIWDGKKANLNETVSFSKFSYPIHFSPEVLTKNSVNLKIEMFRVKNTDVMRKDIKAAKLLDTEIVANFNHPIILGFPTNGNTYFLSIYITRKSYGSLLRRGLLRGRIIKVPSSTHIMMPPSPLYRINPIYPIECRKNKIEGSVILEVSTDKGGHVNKVKVLKSAYPDLDQAALLALKQWRYYSIFVEEEPIPAVFAVSVNFKLRESGLIQEQETQEEDQTDLGRILKNCALYCEKLENLAFHFKCKAKFTEDIYRGPSRGKNTYIYDYKLQKKEDEIAESRILLEENGEKRNEKNAALKTNVFFSERSMFEPLRLLSKNVQDSYDYELIKEEKIFERRVYVVKATPKKRSKNNSNYGKLWIDKENFYILKIELKQESLIGFEELKESLKEQGIEPVLSAVHYYEIEKKGKRFPSRTDFFESYRGLSRFGSRKIKRSKTVIEFYDYKFFKLKKI